MYLSTYYKKTPFKKSPSQSQKWLEMRSSSNVVVALLSQCIMKIPGVFVNIDGGATRRPDEVLNK